MKKILLDFIKKYGAVAGGIILLSTIMSFASPYFATRANFFNLLRQINTNALMAFGITFVLACGCIDLSTGSQIAFASVNIALLIKAGLSFWPALLITFLIGALVGLINGIVVSYTLVPPFIATLAMQFCIRGAAYITSGGLAIKVNSDAFLKFGNGNILGVPNPTIMFIILGLLLGRILSSTSFGRHVLATGGNLEAAQYAGINVKKVKILCYIIMALMCSLAGVIAGSRAYSGQPALGVGYEADAIAAAVLGGVKFGGGRGSIMGTFLGACIIGIIANSLNLLEVGFYYQTMIKGLIILFAVFIDTEQSRKRGGV